MWEALPPRGWWENCVDEVYVAGRVGTQAAEMQRVVRVCEEVGMPFAVPVHSLQFERALLNSTSPSRDGYLHYLNMRLIMQTFPVVIAGKGAS